MDRFVPTRSVWRGLAAAALAAGFLSGCGKGGGSCHVSGTVKFDGRPVPAGKIYFTPDNTKGNNGPTGFATIVDGKYDTAASGGKATVGGDMIVRIEAFDPNAQSKDKKNDTSGEETLKPLFPDYQTTVELPNETTTKDFDVPAEAAKKKYVGERPAAGSQRRIDP